ncbi:hypothetical protein ACFVT2_19130 [Streptomyces sp. NPDC058000]
MTGSAGPGRPGAAHELGLPRRTQTPEQAGVAVPGPAPEPSRSCLTPIG